jgi:DNA-binding XRE family transcriptional regulator
MPHQRRHPWQPEEDEALRALVEAGKSWVLISAKLKRSTNHVQLLHRVYAAAALPSGQFQTKIEVMKKRNLASPRKPTAIDVYIGARMRDRRVQLKISQTALAKTLGVSFQQVQKYESGSNRVSAARLFEICEALQVPLASMFERKLKA